MVKGARVFGWGTRDISADAICWVVLRFDEKILTGKELKRKRENNARKTILE